MSINKKITEDFYRGISEGNIEILESLLDDKFELIVPMSGGVLSGFYKVKKDLWKGFFLWYFILS